MNKQTASLCAGLLVCALLAGCSKFDDTLPAIGQKVQYSAGGISFSMVLVPPKSFPTGIDDSGTGRVENPYLLAESEVTFELWTKVRDWANGNGYSFSNPGLQGSGDPAKTTSQHPVSTINWRDAMVWCNALTEWFNQAAGAKLEPVYYSDAAFTKPIRQSTDSDEVTADSPGSQDAPFVKASATGFRLPTSAEWELAARFKADLDNDGALSQPGEFTPGDHASGANAPKGDIEETSRVAVWFKNSQDSTAPVKSKAPNALGIYDMTGNIDEWCFDWNVNSLAGQTRTSRGGRYLFDVYPSMKLGYANDQFPNEEKITLGLRIARSAPAPLPAR